MSSQVVLEAILSNFQFLLAIYFIVGPLDIFFAWRRTGHWTAIRRIDRRAIVTCLVLTPGIIGSTHSIMPAPACLGLFQGIVVGEGILLLGNLFALACGYAAAYKFAELAERWK